jgi:hypothetical protein
MWQQLRRYTMPVIISVGMAALGTAYGRAQDATAPQLSEGTFQAIVQCFSKGWEIILVSAVRCVLTTTASI